MNFNALLIAYGLIVILSRFFGGRPATAPWEVVITVAMGIAFGLQPIRRPGHKRTLTLASLVAFLVIVALALVARDLFVLLPSVTFVTYGFRGLVNGRIVLAGRVGPGREYTGTAAYLHSTFCILSGAALIALGFIFPGFWNR